MVNKHISQNTKLFILAQIHLKTLKRQEIWWKPVSSWDLRQRPASVCKNVVEESSGNKRGLSENTLVLNSTLSSAYSHTNLHKFHSLSHGLWLERVISLSLGGSTGRSHWGSLLSHWMHPGITPGGLRVGLKIVGFVHILKHVCLDAQKRNRCSAFLCVCVCVRGSEFMCASLCRPLWCLFGGTNAHMGWEHAVHVCVCVCVWLDRGVGGGVALLKSTPLLPCSTCWISTSSFPWSRPSQPPAHLHKAQTGGDVTNKPGTHSAGCLPSMNSFPASRHDKEETQDGAPAKTHLHTLFVINGPVTEANM